MGQVAKFVMQFGLLFLVGSVLLVLTGEGAWWYPILGLAGMGICATLSYKLSGGKDLPR